MGSGSCVCHRKTFCQVEGCSPFRKYENDGGPGLKALFGTLRQPVNAEADMKTLMTAQVLFWLLRAPDGHAKNFSIQLLPRGRFQLTPWVRRNVGLSGVEQRLNQWSPHEIKLAMALFGKNRHYEMARYPAKALNSTVQKVNCASTAEPIIEETLARDSSGHRRSASRIATGLLTACSDAILGGFEQAARNTGGMPP